MKLIENCKTAQQCVSIIDEIAELSEHSYSRISDTEYKLVEKLLKFQPEVTDLLVPILLDKNIDKAQIVARALSDVKTIDKKHLETIKKDLIEGLDGYLLH